MKKEFDIFIERMNEVKESIESTHIQLVSTVDHYAYAVALSLTELQASLGLLKPTIVSDTLYNLTDAERLELEDQFLEIRTSFNDGFEVSSPSFNELKELGVDMDDPAVALWYANTIVDTNIRFILDMRFKTPFHDLGELDEWDDSSILPDLITTGAIVDGYVASSPRFLGYKSISYIFTLLVFIASYNFLPTLFLIGALSRVLISAAITFFLSFLFVVVTFYVSKNDAKDIKVFAGSSFERVMAKMAYVNEKQNSFLSEDFLNHVNNKSYNCVLDDVQENGESDNFIFLIFEQRDNENIEGIKEESEEIIEKFIQDVKENSEFKVSPIITLDAKASEKYINEGSVSKDELLEGLIKGYSFTNIDNGYRLLARKREEE